MMIFVMQHFVNIDSATLRQLRWPSGKSGCLRSCRLGFDSKSGQTNDFKIGIDSFYA